MQVETSIGPCFLWELMLLFTDRGKNYSNAKRRQLKLCTYLPKLTPSQYLGPYRACWSSYYHSCLCHERAQVSPSNLKWARVNSKQYETAKLSLSLFANSSRLIKTGPFEPFFLVQRSLFPMNRNQETSVKCLFWPHLATFLYKLVSLLERYQRELAKKSPTYRRRLFCAFKAFWAFWAFWGILGPFGGFGGILGHFEAFLGASRISS